MQKQYILNRKLNIWETNKITKNHQKKIKKAKSLINYRCPESYSFFKGEFQEGKTKNKCK